MTFKDDLVNDLNEFLKPDEFGETHNLNGAECVAIIEGLTSAGQITRSTVNFAAVHGKTVIIHTKTENLPEVPEKGNVFELDGEIYRVMDSVNDCGMLTITLEVDVI